MTKDEALKLARDALEALEKSTDNFPANVQHKKAITAIKEALAQPEQEPVAQAEPTLEMVELNTDEIHAMGNAMMYDEPAPLPVQEPYCYVDPVHLAALNTDQSAEVVLHKNPSGYATRGLYTSAQPVQEPVAGKGKEYSEQLKLCARNLAFVSAGWVNMSSAAMQEMFALIDHVCAGIDSPPQAECARCKDLEEQAYDLLGQLKVANLKWSVAHPWVGLTDEDVFAVLEELQNMYHRPPSAIFAQAIEAKLKEKNT